MYNNTKKNIYDENVLVFLNIKNMRKKLKKMSIRNSKKIEKSFHKIKFNSFFEITKETKNICKNLVKSNVNVIEC